jgi:hypothetical protein
VRGLGRSNVLVQLCELSSFPIAKLHDPKLDRADLQLRDCVGPVLVDWLPLAPLLVAAPGYLTALEALSLSIERRGVNPKDVRDFLESLVAGN